MKTVAQLKTDIIKDVWPSNMPENLDIAIGNHFQEAFADICKWVDCEKLKNVNLVHFCQTNYKKGMSVMAAPKGRIFRVFTVANQDFGDPVFYRQVPWPHPEAWARNLYLSPQVSVTGPRKRPLGFEPADPANDSLYGRARTGIWSNHNGNLYLAPWIQSNELVVIEWDGIKEYWSDGDLVNPEIHYRKAVKLYVQFAYERDFGQLDRAAAFSNNGHMGQYDLALGDLIHECNERTKLRADDSANTHLERNRLCDELADDAIVIDADGVTIADIGNLSAPGADVDAVTALVRSWGPNAITGSGFIAGAITDYDLTAGNSLSTYIAPYIGNKGVGGDINGLWPAPSAADWAKDNLTTFDQFFPIPNNGRYYSIVLGDIQLFVLDTSASEPDGITAASVQGVWLQTLLALSTAPWKIVKMDRCPFGSVYSSSDLQWPFQGWGASLVLCSQARNYERLQVGTLPIINNGLGGLGPIEEIAQPSPTTVAAYAQGYGAGKIVATSESLVYEFTDVNGKVIDTLTLTK